MSASVRVLSVVGARPQFIKAAIVSRALRRAGIAETLVHTGQHYDEAMSDRFFRQLEIGAPAYELAVGSGPHGAQTGRMLEALERVMAAERPDRVLVYGDTNSTLAGALAAAKLQLPVDHVEAGLRSFDRDMPEELNRVLTDQLSDLLFCPTATAVANLTREGIADGVQFVGDVMLDLALEVRPRALATPSALGLRDGEYFVATVHRAANTDDPARLSALLDALEAVATRVAPVVLPVHPRLAARVGAARPAAGGALRLIEPLGYFEMQALILRARGVITDSGGVQKEALFHGVRCVTLRDSTEWQETLDANMNTLLGDDLDALPDAASRCAGREEMPDEVYAAFGGGRAGEAIAGAIARAGGSRRRWSGR